MRRVYCTFEVEGFHAWKHAGRDSSEGYLKHRHRHMFKCKCSIGVDGVNRQIEFISMRRYLVEFLTEGYGAPCEFDNMSCENIAEQLIWAMKNKYGTYKECMVDVSEDGENGSVVATV